MKNRLKKFLYSYFLLVLFIFIYPISINGNKNFIESEPLSVEEAFQIDFLVLSPTEIIIRWEIDNSYYLYKKKITFSSLDYTIQKVRLPTGKIKEDPYFGKSEVYYEILEATLIIKPKNQENSSGIIFVEYQGCWEGGVCYPVQKTLIMI